MAIPQTGQFQRDYRRPRRPPDYPLIALIIVALIVAIVCIVWATLLQTFIILKCPSDMEFNQSDFEYNPIYQTNLSIIQKSNGIMWVDISAYPSNPYDTRIAVSIEEPGGHYTNYVTSWEIGIQSNNSIGLRINIGDIDLLPRGQYHITIRAENHNLAGKLQTCECGLYIRGD